MAVISFPRGNGAIGLSVFQKLREYRKRHEHEWGDEIISQKDEDGKPLPKRKRARKICDQRANSVADISAVLGMLDSEAVVEVAKKEDSIGLIRDAGDKKAVKDESKKGGKIGLTGEGTGVKVEVSWRNLNDAEYAETWSENVEHCILEPNMEYKDPSRERELPVVDEPAEPEPQKVVL